jgi:hypothetical protein
MKLIFSWEWEIDSGKFSTQNNNKFNFFHFPKEIPLKECVRTVTIPLQKVLVDFLHKNCAKTTIQTIDSTYLKSK